MKFVVTFLSACLMSFSALAADAVRSQVYAYKAQDSLSPEVVRTVISGAVAKAIYDQLAVPVTVIGGLDGDQQTKSASGVECGIVRGKNYFCNVDFTAKGVAVQ